MDAKYDRQSDPFHPPAIPTQVYCLHCQQEYESYLIQWVEIERDGAKQGFWCCPMPGCDGKGFGFDIFPTDPDYRDENGERMWSGDGEDEDEEDGAWPDDEAESDDDGVMGCGEASESSWCEGGGERGGWSGEQWEGEARSDSDRGPGDLPSN